MFYTYVLYSKKDGNFYTGFTKDLKLFNRVKIIRTVALKSELVAWRKRFTPFNLRLQPFNRGNRFHG